MVQPLLNKSRRVYARFFWAGHPGALLVSQLAASQLHVESHPILQPTHSILTTEGVRAKGDGLQYTAPQANIVKNLKI